MPALGALRALCSVVLEALFPVPEAEREVLAMDPGRALVELPRARQFPVAEAGSVFSYKDERTRQLIWSLKYRKSRRAAEIAGYALAQALRTYASVAGNVLIVPMPISKKRRRERGYNQCELLADAITKAADHPHSKDLIVVRDLLVRARHKSRQTLKDRASRLKSAQDLFAVNERAAHALKSSGAASRLIIVIDDVVTTGSTIKDAVAALRAAGFENVFGLSVAH